MRARKENPEWVQGLRSLLRVSVGTAYRISEQRGRAKIDVRMEDGTRKYGTLPIGWQAGNAKDIQLGVERIAELVKEGQSLAASIKRVQKESSEAPTIAGEPNPDLLLKVWDYFKDYKLTRAPARRRVKATTWKKEYEGKTKRGLIAGVKCTDAKSFLWAAGEQWEIGSRARQQAIQHLCQMLDWAVDEGLLDAARWETPKDQRTVGGGKSIPKKKALALKDQQILDFLKTLERPRTHPRDEKARKQWLFCLQLMSCYGLRPIETQHLEKRGDDLWCTYRKPSGGYYTVERKLVAFPERWAIQWRLLERFGKDSLPPVRSISEALGDYLSRNEDWKPLSGLGATAYSFRHGYALRLHLLRMDRTFAAKLMGHSEETHARHYGDWADDETMADVVQKARQLEGLLSSSPSS